MSNDLAILICTVICVCSLILVIAGHLLIGFGTYVGMYWFIWVRESLQNKRLEKARADYVKYWVNYGMSNMPERNDQLE